MSMRDWLRETWASATNIGTQARIIPTWQAGRPLPAPDDFVKFSTEAYRRNTIVASCVWAIATSASEPKLVVHRKQRDGTLLPVTDPDDLLVRLLARPNPEQSTYAFLEALFTAQQVTGNWFVREVRADAGNVVQLWPLRPDKVNIVPGADGWVQRYDYTAGGGAITLALPAQDVIHDPLHPDLLNDYWGLSPIAVLARSVDLDNNGYDYLRAFFLNDGTPAGLLKFKAKVKETDRQRVKELWQKEHTGAAGWHTMSVLDADAEYQQIGSDPQKLRLGAIFDETETRICAAFGVPAIIAGALAGLNRATYANYKEARQSFWKDTLAPLYRRCASRLTEGLAPEFGDDYVIDFDLSTVEALQEDRDVKRTFALAAYEKGVITLNQALEACGYPPVDDGDVRKAPAVPAFGGLLEGQRRGHAHETHAQKLDKAQRKARAQIRRVMKQHFSAQGEALIEALK